MISINVDKHRCKKLIERAIRDLSLDLRGLVVLTEAATGYYSLTSMIAALAGAKRVYLLTRDSRYGKASDIKNGIMKLAHSWGVGSKVFVLPSREDKRIREADIVTNLGFVRPLDRVFLSRLNPRVVIPLMWETWEFRPDELDLPECRRLNIPVLGTNEGHDLLCTFEYIGYVAMKALLVSGVEIFLSRIVVLGDNKFGTTIVSKLRNAGAEVTYIDPKDRNICLKSRAALKNADALVIADHCNGGLLIGSKGAIRPKELYKINRGLTIIHICGDIDPKGVRAAGLNLFPDKIASAGYMSLTTDYAGPKPLVYLHAAGLKVAQEMAVARKHISDASKVETKVLKRTDLAQAFVRRGAYK